MNQSSEESPAGVPRREGFSSGFGVLAATLGSAVGLGNIWKFPYLTGTNGGAGFLVVYILATCLVGLPVMIAEIMLGRKAKANAYTTMKTLSPPRQPWWLISVCGVLAAFLIMAFYTEVAGWVFAYVFKAMGSSLLSNDPQHTSAVFGELIADPVQSLFWQWVVLALMGVIILFGVTRGIEAATKRLMPILFILLLVVGIRALLLPGASVGLKFLFQPDFSKITSAMMLTAFGLAFFKLSVGMGTMMTYGSYFRDDQNIPATAVRVMIADLVVSLLAGIAIFPAVFAFGFQPTSGPSLLFITIPAVFHSMPFGQVFMLLFFILTAVASMGAMLSLLQVPIALFSERFGMKRPLATLLTLLSLAIVGSGCALSNSTMSDFKLFGMTLFDLFDYLTSNIMMPLGGIGLCLFISFIWGRKRLAEALSNNGQLANQRWSGVLFFLLRWISPILILWVMLAGLHII